MEMYMYISTSLYILYNYITYLELKTMIVQNWWSASVQGASPLQDGSQILYPFFSGIAMLYIYIISIAWHYRRTFDWWYCLPNFHFLTDVIAYQIFTFLTDAIAYQMFTVLTDAIAYQILTLLTDSIAYQVFTFLNDPIA